VELRNLAIVPASLLAGYLAPLVNSPLSLAVSFTVKRNRRNKVISELLSNTLAGGLKK